MSDTKSLGSSPIGYHSTGMDNYNFIPDLGPVKERESSEPAKYSPQKDGDYQQEENNSGKQKSKPKKKIASYNLEVRLIERLKKIADKNGIFYSQFVSDAINKWIEEHDY